MTLLILAVAYALLFWTVTWSRPTIALLLIFALAPFQNDLSAGGPVRFSIAEINLLLTAPVFLFRRRLITLGPLAAPVLAYVAISTFSSALHWRDAALTSLIQIVLYLAIVVIIFRSLPRDTTQYRPALFCLVGICTFLACVVLVHHSGYVLGLHKNGTGSSLACGMVVCVELWLATPPATIRKNLLLGSMLIIGAGLLFTLSRGAWMTTVTGVLLILTLRRQFSVMLRTGVILAPLAAICWSYLPSDSREYATAFDRDNFNILARYEWIDYALNTFSKNPLTGVGVSLRKEYDATNVILLTLAETGVPGLIALLSIHLALLHMVWDGQRRIPRTSPDFSFLAIATALVIGKMMHGVVDHYWGRGDTMIVWASAGMALRVCTTRRIQRAYATASPHVSPQFIEAQPS